MSFGGISNKISRGISEGRWLANYYVYVIHTHTLYISILCTYSAAIYPVVIAITVVVASVDGIEDCTIVFIR